MNTPRKFYEADGMMESHVYMNDNSVPLPIEKVTEPNDKERTAMQELINHIQLHFDWFIKNSPYDGVVPLILKKAERLLETERKNIIEAYTDGQLSVCDLLEREKVIKSKVPRDDNEDAVFYFTNKYQTP